MSFLDNHPLDWRDPDLLQLLDICIARYGTPAQAEELANRAGITRGAFPLRENMQLTWSALLEVMAGQGKMRVLVEQAAGDPTAAGHQEALGRLLRLPASGGQPDPSESLPPPGVLPPAKRMLPPGFRLFLPPNPHFTGRQEDLHALAKLLLYNDGGTVAVTATGIGGIGKTQLAVEFAYRYGRFLHGVHWLDATKDLNAEIADCGERMGLRPWPEALTGQTAATLRAWQANPYRLVILDGAEDPGRVRAWLAQMPGVRLLLTSRNPDWPADVQTYSLGTLPEIESITLLAGLAPDLAGDRDMSELAYLLGYLPLALDLAGNYLADRCRQNADYSVADCLREIAGQANELQHTALRDWVSAQDTPTHHAASLAATFMLSWRQLDPLDEHDAVARRLFLLAGYCAPNTPIQPALLARALDLDVAGAELARARRRLSNLGLVLAGRAGPTLHTLLAAFARLQDASPSDDDGQQATLADLADALVTETYLAGETRLPHTFASLRPHLQAALPYVEEAGLENSGALWNNLGYHLEDLADYQGARAAYERALANDEQLYGPAHPVVAIRVGNLAGVLQDLGDLAGALGAAERALAIDEAVFGREHPKVAIRLNNMATVLRDLRDLEGARAAYVRALAISEAGHGPDHPTVATCVNNLGLVLQESGDLAGARAAFERALTIDRTAFGPDHPSVAIRINNLGRLSWQERNLPAAVAAITQALAIFEKHLPEQHPWVLSARKSLEELRREMGSVPTKKSDFSKKSDS